MALEEYGATIGRIEVHLQEWAPSVAISNSFDFDRSAQKFVVHFPAGPFALFVVQSAFETYPEETLLNLIGGIVLVPGEQRILTDSLQN